MAQTDIILPAQSTAELPVVRSIGPADLRDALAKGLDDFREMPTHALFLSLIYPIVGIALGAATVGYDVIPLLYPLAAGFALIGPFAAIGLYELSRRRELGLDTSWQHAFDVIHSPSLRSIAALGFLLLVILCVWLAAADAIYVANFGIEPTKPGAFLRNVFITPEGQNVIIVGNAVGFLFALLAFCLSAVSFKVIWKNPLTMALWGLFVAGALAVGSIPIFFGLAVVMPVLGHATWHLYRRAVEPPTGPRPEYQPRPRGKRYAADFPVSLFVASRPRDEQ
jgi:uncharacterized membrane protein